MRERRAGVGAAHSTGDPAGAEAWGREGAVLGPCEGGKEPPVIADEARHTLDVADDFLSELYRSAKTGGTVESEPVKDPGKPGAGESHARFDEGGLETE